MLFASTHLFKTLGATFFAAPCRAVLSLDLKVSVDTVMPEITVSGRLFQIVGEAWQKALLERLRTAGRWHREIVAVLESITLSNMLYILLYVKHNYIAI